MIETPGALQGAGKDIYLEPTGTYRERRIKVHGALDLRGGISYNFMHEGNLKQRLV